MKLCVAIVHNRDRTRLIDKLVEENFQFTVVASIGGFLREGSATIMVGCDESRVPLLKELLSEICQSREQLVSVAPYDAGPSAPFMATPVPVTVGGAVMFVLPVDEVWRA